MATYATTQADSLARREKARKRLQTAHQLAALLGGAKGGPAGGKPMVGVAQAAPGGGPAMAGAAAKPQPARPKPEAQHADEVNRRYGEGGADRRTARAEFAREHGEASADYRTWKPSTVAEAKRHGLFGGAVDVSHDLMPALLRAARGHAAGGGGLLQHSGVGTAGQGAPTAPGGGGQVSDAAIRLQALNQLIVKGKRRRRPSTAMAGSAAGAYTSGPNSGGGGVG
jgi:hypothetical protein